MVRRILEADDELPEAIADTIRKAVGGEKNALQAAIIVGLLQALQVMISGPSFSEGEYWKRYVSPRAAATGPSSD